MSELPTDPVVANMEDLRRLAQNPDELATTLPEQGRSGHPVVHLHRYIGVFDQESLLPEANKPVRVMVTNAICHSEPNKEALIHYLFVRVVTDDVTLIAHEGFCRHGAYGLVTATAHIQGMLATLTPGRTKVRVVDPSTSHGLQPTLMPGFIYVRTRDLQDWLKRSEKVKPFALPPIRAEGLISVFDLQAEYQRSISRMQRYLSKSTHVKYFKKHTSNPQD